MVIARLFFFKLNVVFLCYFCKITMDVTAQDGNTRLNEGISNLYHAQHLCDITFTTSPPINSDEAMSGEAAAAAGAQASESVQVSASVECHGLVLAAHCDYWKKNLMDTNDGDLHLNIIDMFPLNINAIKEVLDFMYDGKCRITTEVAVDMYEVCKQWQFQGLMAPLEEFLAQDLTTANVMSLYKTFCGGSNTKGKKKSLQFIQEHFEEICFSKEFGSLEYEDVCSILTSGDVEISEDSIFGCVTNWIDYNGISECHAELFNLIKFDRISQDFLIDVVMSHPQMQVAPRMQIVKNAVRRRLTASLASPSETTAPPLQTKQDAAANAEAASTSDGKVTETNEKNTSQAQSSTAEPSSCAVQPSTSSASPAVLSTSIFEQNRKASSVDHLVIVDNQQSICEYKNGHWVRVCTAPLWMDTKTVMCAEQGVVAFVGASCQCHGSNASVLAMSNAKKELYHLPNMLCDLRNPGVAITEDLLFVFGGVNTLHPTTLVHNISLQDTQKGWSRCTGLIVPVECPIVVTVDSCIFAIGGINCHNQQVKFNQIYKVNNNTWTRRTPAPSPCSSDTDGVVFQDGVIKIFQQKQAMFYNLENDSWQVFLYKPTKRITRPLMLNGQIVACTKHQSTDSKRFMKFCNKTWEPEYQYDVQSCLNTLIVSCKY